MAEQTIAPPAPQHHATIHPYVCPHQDVQPSIANKQRDAIYLIFIPVVVFIFLAGIFSLIIWQIRLSTINHPHFHVEALTVSNFSVSSYSYSGAWDAQFIVRNPNSKTSIHCDYIEVAVMYKFCGISEITTVPSFVEEPKKETAIRARFNYLQTVVFNFEEGGETSHGVIKFNLWMMVRVRPRVWGAGRTMLRVFCPDLQVLVSSRNQSGILIGGGMKKKCKVDSNELYERLFREQMMSIRNHVCLQGLYDGPYY